MLLREVSDDQIDIVLTHARELVAMELAGCSELTDAALALCGKRARMLKVRVCASQNVASFLKFCA